MSTVLKQVGRWGLIFLMLVSFAVSLGYADRLKYMKDITMLYLEEGTLKESAATHILHEEQKRQSPVRFTAWVQNESQDLFYKEFNRHTPANVLYICGDSSLITDSTTALKSDDSQGCLLSEKTAYALFGSIDAAGLSLSLGDRELTVRGVLKDTDVGENLIVVQINDNDNLMTGGKENANPGTDVKSDNYSGAGGKENYNLETDVIVNSNSGTGEDLAVRALAIDTEGMNEAVKTNVIESFSERYGINGQVADFTPYKNIAGFFSEILPVCIIMFVVYAVISRAALVKSKPFIYALHWLTVLVVLVISIKMCGFSLHISESMIPNRWSDFDFWKTLFDDYIRNLRLLGNVMKQTPEVRYISPMLQTIVFSILAAVFFLVSGRGLKTNSYQRLIWNLCLSLVLEYLIILFLASKDLLPEKLAAVWLLYPFYMILKYLLNRFKILTIR